MNKFILILGIVATAFTSNAAYLFWQVTEKDAEKIESYEYVSISYKVNGSEGGLTKIAMATKDAAANNINQVNLSMFESGTTYSIFVELWNYDKTNDKWTQVGQTVDDQISYTAFAQNCEYIDAGFSPTTPVSLSVWHGGTIDVPEPTSAMLVMVGLSFLALKRRKV